MAEKLEYRTCPECGKIYVKKNVSHIMLGHISVIMTCEDGHQWEEFYTMQYIGYKYKDICKNRFDEIDKEEEQSNDEVQGSKP